MYIVMWDSKIMYKLIMYAKKREEHTYINSWEYKTNHARFVA